MKKAGMDRRSMLKSVGATVGLGAVAAATGGCGNGAASIQPGGGNGESIKARKPSDYKNDDFYTAGKFDEGKAKDAIIALMKFHGYPVFPEMKENLWVSDYNTGQFTKLGLAARMWMNNAKDRYMLMDLFLMPGQMLPEHWHLDGTEGDDAGNPAKREGWLVRHGLSYIVGIGDDNMAEVAPDVVVPKCHCGGTTTTRHCVKATPGTFVALAKVESKHWQWGGPEGAIITEVANVHSNSAVRHQDKACNDFFLKPPEEA